MGTLLHDWMHERASFHDMYLVVNGLCKLLTEKIISPK